LWKRATGAYPFNLGKRWVGGETKMPADMQYDFVSTNDIIGGNSGSPVLSKDGRIIGLAFDGNIHSTGGSYGFDPKLNRMVSVSSQAIVGALRNIYGVTALADELVR
jgi:V8-like Glu-specific endopeptidase